MLRTFSSLPLAAQMIDGFKIFAPRGEPEGARPASDKIFASPSGDVSLHPSQTLPYGACPPIPFLEKRINILLDEYISTTKIRAN